MLLLCYFITWSKLTRTGPDCTLSSYTFEVQNTGWCEKNLSYFSPNYFSNLVPPIILNCTKVFQTWNHDSSHCQINIVNSHSIYFTTGWRKSRFNRGIKLPQTLVGEFWLKVLIFLPWRSVQGRLRGEVAKGPKPKTSMKSLQFIWVI